MEEGTSLVLPGEWMQYFDENYQTFYFYNEVTGETRWDPPDERIEGKESVEEDESVYGEDEGQLVALKFSGREERIDAKANRLGEEGGKVGGKNQDYLALARIYKKERPYSDPNFLAICVLCEQQESEDVFFPCEHRCVCRKCIRSEKIVSDSELRAVPGGYCNCSLCASVIKLILPFEFGLEVEKYWNWVYEVPVDMPPGFMKNFRHSAAVIKAVYIDDEKDRASEFCAIS